MDAIESEGRRPHVSKTALWAVVGVLAATSLGEGYYIYAQHRPKGPAAPDPWEEPDRWLSEARKHAFRDSPIPFRQFDDLFDDKFFGRRFEPFSEMERFHKRMRAMLGEAEQPWFDRSWDGWFDERINAASLAPRVTTTDDEVVLAFKVPGLERDSLNVSVDENRVRVAYDARSVDEKRDGEGRSAYRSESVQHLEKVLPIPEGADATQSRIVREGDSVKVIFKRRPRGAAKT